ncbi:MAG: hypothetical protein AB8B96_13640 [Lysobacterales bacterium]
MPKLNGARDQRTVVGMSQLSTPGSGPSQDRAKVVLALFLLLFTVPWWPGLDGQIAGIPMWAMFSLIAAVVYASIVAWLLERHWDDGEPAESSETRQHSR